MCIKCKQIFTTYPYSSKSNQTDWEVEFNKLVANNNQRFLRGVFWDEEDAAKQVKTFIRTEVIAKLIEEIPAPTGFHEYGEEDINNIKQQLRKEWL